MRLTITRKIALAVIGIVMLCIGTMAWVTSQNLQRGFIDYLNEVQTQDLEKLGEMLADRYRENGSFESMRNNRDALRLLLDQIHPRQGEADDDRPPPRPRNPDGYGPGRPPPPGMRDAERDPGSDDEGPDFRRPRRPPPPPLAATRPANRPPADPLGFGQRLSLQDANGQVLIGPPDTPPGIVRPIVAEGRTVGILSLKPLRQISNASDTGFIRSQVRKMLWLAATLIGVSIVLAIWLARHFLRPIAGLRSATQQIAQGKFSARAPVLNRDELSELAEHVNAMAQALERGEQQRRKMLADVSHELRTPLTVIRGEIEALLDGIRQADPRALDSLHAEVLRLNKLVDDLHQITLADAGDLRYQRRDVDLGALLATVVERFRTRAKNAGLGLSLTLPQLAPWVHADPDRLTQVIANLLENSLRYTDAGGVIACALTLRGGQAELVVEDSAPGVPDGMHAQLFERLFRADAARSRTQGQAAGGSGLGLSICKAMIEAHGGSIRAEASPLGGVRMVVRLPLIPTPD